jgi:hypothetical protein
MLPVLVPTVICASAEVAAHGPLAIASASAELVANRGAILRARFLDPSVMALPRSQGV